MEVTLLFDLPKTIRAITIYVKTFSLLNPFNDTATIEIVIWIPSTPPFSL